MPTRRPSLAKGSVRSIGKRCMIGRGILIDVARFPITNKDVLELVATVTHADLLKATKAQGTEIRKRDILLIRTGWISAKQCNID